MVGREYQHLEDFVFIEPQGAAYALYVLKNIHNYTISIKWDGNPTIYFGRDQNNKFMLVGKNAWGKQPISSTEELQQWIVSRGKQEFWREHFAKSMIEMWNILEAETTHKGYLYADVLWSPVRPLGFNSQNLYFNPNMVIYTIDPKSDLGTAVKPTKLGMAVHKHYANFGDLEGKDVGKVDFSTKSVATITQNILKNDFKTPEEAIRDLEKLVNKNVNAIEELFFFTPPGMSDIRNIIYTYVNYQVKERKFKNITDLKEFDKWVDGSKLSFPKQGKLKKMLTMHEDKFQKLFDTVYAVSEVKNLVIDEVVKSIDGVSFTKGYPAGEGFVLNEPKIKLVPRQTWIPRR